jgi:chorismate mutase/prephenate dehydratase
MDEQIARIRNRIDALDRALVRLLSRRARHSLEIGRRKRAAGGRLFSHARERQIAENVRHANRGPLPDRILVELYETLLRLTRRAVRDALRREEREGQSRDARQARGAKARRSP